MATNAAIREAIFQAINLDSVQAYKYPPDNITAPAAVVAGFDYTPSTFGEGRRTEVTVMVAVSRSHVDHLVEMDTLLDDTGAGSVVAAINATDEAGISMAVQSVGSYGTVAFADVEYYGALITVEVYA
jgi:hypothetical protein